jgi:hypothetical protein
MSVPPLPRPGDGKFFESYTRGLTSRDIERLFTRDTPEAYRFFSRHIDVESLKKLPWHRRTIMHARLFFLAFTLKHFPSNQGRVCRTCSNEKARDRKRQKVGLYDVQ